jgi:Immunoglobulin domain
MCFDSARNALVLFGGYDTGQTYATNYTYEMVYQDTPAVLKQPTVQSVVLGGHGQISVVAAGAPPISYQWQKDGVNLTNSDHLLGSTNDTLQIVSVGAADFGLYRLVLSNHCGVTVSQPIQLRVTAPALSVAVSGDNLNIAWSDPAATLQTATSPAGPWTPVPATSPYTVVPNKSKGFFRLVH